MAQTLARGIAAVDLDGSGHFGVAIANWEGPNRLYTWDKTRFRETASRKFAEPSRARSMVSGDFDNDGNEELFINVMGQPNRLFGWRENRWQPLDLGDALEPEGGVDDPEIQAGPLRNRVDHLP